MLCRGWQQAVLRLKPRPRPAPGLLGVSCLVGWQNPPTTHSPTPQFWSWSRPPPVTFSIVLPASPRSPAALARAARQAVAALPPQIPRPDYALTGRPDKRLLPAEPVRWGGRELVRIREAARLAASILREVGDAVQPGVTTKQLDMLARELFTIHGAFPSALNFHGFPASISTSVNNVAAHGIPDSRPLQEGDIVNVDCAAFLAGFHGDCSDTFAVGEVDTHAEKLVGVARNCLAAGVAACGPGRPLTGIGRAVHNTARRAGCSVVPLFLGHGIGDFYHGQPEVYHSLNNYPGTMKPGMVFTIEPVVSEGDRRVRILEDGWTAVTVDNSRTAQAEHTVLITETGVEILSRDR